MPRIQLIAALAVFFLVGGSLAPTLAQFVPPPILSPSHSPGLGSGPGAGPRPFYSPRRPGHLGSADRPRGENAGGKLGRGYAARRGNETRERRSHGDKAGVHYRRNHDRNYERHSRDLGRRYGKNRHHNKYYYGIYGYPDGSYSSENQYYYSSSNGNHVRWCVNRYRSYDTSTDTYLGSDGYWHRCRSPY